MNRWPGEIFNHGVDLAKRLGVKSADQYGDNYILRYCYQIEDLTLWCYLCGDSSGLEVSLQVIDGDRTVLEGLTFSDLKRFRDYAIKTYSPGAWEDNIERDYQNTLN